MKRPGKKTPPKSRLQRALKKSTKTELFEVIRAALDCPSHFNKPTIVKNKNEDFEFGKGAIVICDQCVDRLREVLELKEGEEVPTSFQFEGWE